MNNLVFKIKHTTQRLLWVSLTLFACGCASLVYASSTKQLDISAEFRFETFKTTKLDLTVTDTNGDAIEGKLIRVFSVPLDAQSTNESDIDKRSTLLIARTDAFGRVYTDIQITNSTKQLLLVVDVVGTDNKVLKGFSGEETISNHFVVAPAD